MTIMNGIDALAGAISPTWPCLTDLGLNLAQLSSRLAAIGVSDANVILSGDSGRIERLWREKRGEIEAEDLSSVLPVMLVSWTEAFNRQWFERESGLQVSRIGEVGLCDHYAWRRCTLDGFVGAKGAVFEAKHVGAFVKPEEVLERYMPLCRASDYAACAGNVLGI